MLHELAAICEACPDAGQSWPCCPRNSGAAAIVAHTVYSGVEAPQAALELGLNALARLDKSAFAATTTWRTCIQSFDFDPMARRMLATILSEDKGRKACIFGDLLGRLPETAQTCIGATLPDVNGTKKVKGCRARARVTANYGRYSETQRRATAMSTARFALLGR